MQELNKSEDQVVGGTVALLVIGGPVMGSIVHYVVQK